MELMDYKLSKGEMSVWKEEKFVFIINDQLKWEKVIPKSGLVSAPPHLFASDLICINVPKKIKKVRVVADARNRFAIIGYTRIKEN